MHYLKISIIIPTFNEAEIIRDRLARLKNLSGNYEIIVVDGGSEDATKDIAVTIADIVTEGERGRAAQMNKGGGLASGDILLFLHADTILPEDALFNIQKALTEDTSVIGGRFDIAFDNSSYIYHLLAWAINLRSRLTKIATGDQGIFIRRDIFLDMGGYPDIPLMEDIEFTKRMKRIGKVYPLRGKVITSARRWERGGFIKTILLMHFLRWLYFAGVDPKTLKRFYKEVR